MATQTRIKFISKGFKEILCSPGASNVCREEAVRIMSAASSASRFGGTFSIHSEIAYRFGSARVEWFVKAADDDALKACSEDHVLAGAI